MNELKNTKLNEEQENKSFIKKHWKKGVVALVLVCGAGYTMHKFGKKGGIVKDFFDKKATCNLDTGILTKKDILNLVSGPEVEELDIPAFKSAHIDELWKEDDDILGIMHDVGFEDLGEFGKELKEKIPELKDKDFVHFPCIGFTKYNAD